MSKVGDEERKRTMCPTTHYSSESAWCGQGGVVALASDVHDLETDLLYLRKGAGVTPERMTDTGVLRLAGCDFHGPGTRWDSCVTIRGLLWQD